MDKQRQHIRAPERSSAVKEPQDPPPRWGGPVRTKVRAKADTLRDALLLEEPNGSAPSGCQPGRQSRLKTKERDVTGRLGGHPWGRGGDGDWEGSALLTCFSPCAFCTYYVPGLMLNC